MLGQGWRPGSGFHPGSEYAEQLDWFEAAHKTRHLGSRPDAVVPPPVQQRGDPLNWQSYSMFLPNDAEVSKAACSNETRPAMTSARKRS